MVISRMINVHLVSEASLYLSIVYLSSLATYLHNVLIRIGNSNNFLLYVKSLSICQYMFIRRFIALRFDGHNTPCCVIY